QIEIRDLFYNTPARLKFQKTEATEAANVGEAVLRLALAHPEIHFRLRAGGRVVLDLPAHQKLGERVRAAFARRGAGALHEAYGEEGGHQVRVFLAAPDEASTTARSTFLFVGRRFIRDRSLLHALSLGYGDLLEKGRYPLAALFLEVPGSELDVNVHPQKLEVRFARAAEVYAAVRHVVGGGVARAPWLASARGAVRVHALPPPDRGVAGEQSGRSAAGVGFGGPSQIALSRAPAFPLGRGGMPGAAAEDGRPAGGRPYPWEARDDHWPAPPPALARGDQGQDPAPAFSSAEGYFQSLSALSYLGQLRKTYLVCESSDDLVLIDQHAAHERVAFERFRVAHARGEIRRQRLLFPVPIDIGPGPRTFSGDDLRALESLGFEFDTAAAATGRLVLRAVPELLKDADPKPLLCELLRRFAAEEVAQGDVALSARNMDEALAVMACHSVVRAGEALGLPQAQALLAQLDNIDLQSHRPHGRPILLRFPIPDIERRFGRG
ncbi:MAG: hypothetical protein ABIW57_11680, partial [Polyangia bacterium]